MRVAVHQKMSKKYDKITDFDDLLHPWELVQISIQAYNRYCESLFNSLSVISRPLLSAIWPQLCSFRINSVSLVILPPSTVQVLIVTVLYGVDSEIWWRTIFFKAACAQCVLGSYRTLNIYNTNKISIFCTQNVWGIIPYISFCLKLSLLF